MHHRIICNLSSHLPNAVSLSHLTCSAYLGLLPTQFRVSLLFTFPFYTLTSCLGLSLIGTEQIVMIREGRLEQPP